MILEGKQQKQSKTQGERIRLFLEELGPTFVKLGQFASTRRDLLPLGIIRELEKLQDDVPPFPFYEAKTIIETELAHSIEEIFREFNEQPLAAASIGQVHEAILHSGERVAVKIQRPQIARTVKTDLEILHNLAKIAEQRLEWAARYELQEIIEEFSISLKAELDYTKEGHNAERIGKQFENDATIHIPAIYWDYTTQKILTMEYLSGSKLVDEAGLISQGYNLHLLAERFVDAMFEQIFINGFFHSDPHPGNILATGGEVIAFIDFGAVGQITSDMKNHLSSFVIALMRQNTDELIKAIMGMGMITEEVNKTALQKDLDQLRDKYYDVPLSRVSLGEAVNDLFSVSYKHHMKIPPDLALLGKTLLTMEGMVEKLDPNLSIIKMAEPFGRKLFKKRFHPKKVAKDVLHDAVEYRELIAKLPSYIRELSTITKRGKVQVEMSVPEIRKLMKKMDSISNKLSFSIVLLSFSIIMTGLIVGSALLRQSTLLWNIPVIEVGFIVAFFMFLWILYAIFKSGRF